MTQNTIPPNVPDFVAACQAERLSYKLSLRLYRRLYGRVATASFHAIWAAYATGRAAWEGPTPG